MSSLQKRRLEHTERRMMNTLDPETTSPRQEQVIVALEKLQASAQALAWYHPIGMQPIADQIIALKILIPQALAEAHEDGQEYARETVADWTGRRP